MSGVTAKKTPTDRALDVFVYGPLGFVLEAKELLPKLAERGREQVTTQVGMARVIGEFAVKTGQSEATKRLGPLQEATAATLGELGLWPSPEPVQPATPVVPQPSEAPAAAPAKAAATNGKAPAVEALAIPDYDGLAASQVVPRLEGLATDELESVRQYEAAHRGRKTVLGKIAQLQTN